MEEVEKQLRQFISNIHRRLRIQCLLQYVGIALAAGFGICLILSLISCVIPFYAVYAVEQGILLTAFFTGVILAILRTPTKEKAALLADSRGYQEKFSTAYALLGKEGVFEKLQKEDACSQIASFSVKEQFPIRVSAKRTVPFCFLAVLCLASQFLETPARQMAAEQNAFLTEKKEEEKHLEKVEKELAKQTKLSEKESAKVKELFETARAQIKDSKTKEELQQAEERLQKKLQTAGDQTKNKELSSMLAKEADRAGEKASQTKQEQQMAKNGQQNGNDQNQELQGENGAQENGTNSGENPGEKSTQGANGESAGSGAEGKNSDGQTESSSGDATQSSGDNGEGTNSGSSGEGNAGAGNNGQGADGQGNGGQGNGSGQGFNRGSKEGKEGELQAGESIAIPKGEMGDDENLTGNANGNKKNSQYEKTEQSDAWAGDKVEYATVSAEYRKKALEQTERAQYPAEMKEKIKQYFSGLN